MAGAGADALVVTHLPNIFYLWRVHRQQCRAARAGPMRCISSPTAATRSRRARRRRRRRCISSRKPLADACGELLRGRSSRQAPAGRVRAGSSERGRMDAPEKGRRAQRFAGKPTAGLVEGCARSKAPAELDVMREAAKLGSEVMVEAIGLRPAGRERTATWPPKSTTACAARAPSGPSFETIVASGPRSALPHAHPTEKRLQKNELVVLDLGAILRHYCSDLTRTVFLGRAPAEVRRWYQAVEQAQQAALRGSWQPGVTAGARGPGRAAGSRAATALGRYFVHSTGHGLGIEIHESPRLGRGQKQEIRAGNVVTLEPGIYIEGVGGIRIEDEVAVHAGGTEVLTSAPRGLLEL